MVEEVLNQGDLAVAHELISPDCVHHFPGDALAPGTAGRLRDWLSLRHHNFPEFTPSWRVNSPRMIRSRS
jgi:hypothetical protein